MSSSATPGPYSLRAPVVLFEDLDDSLERALNRVSASLTHSSESGLSYLFLEHNPFALSASLGGAPSLRQSLGIPLTDMEQAQHDHTPLLPEETAPAPPPRTWREHWNHWISRVKGHHAHIRLGDNEPVVQTDRHVYPLMPQGKYPSNAVLNAKYNAVLFMPIVLYEQFKFFFNLYFLIVALSQAIPALRIGYLLLYVVPLLFVLLVTMFKEAVDDLQRRRRDREQNNELYEVVNNNHKLTPLKSLAVGDLVRLHKDVRIPADMVLLHLLEPNGELFIKTDQLDGETDWKLRVACSLTQAAASERLSEASLVVLPPSKDIHTFLGTLTYNNTTVPLLVDQTLWANTVLASGSAVGMVVYTGSDTRQAMNTTRAGVKTGLLELEINSILKILCVCVFVLLVVLVAAHGWRRGWYVDIMRFLILFSTIIPVSLRVNLDLGKLVYAYQIEHDQQIPETVVRTSTIPEDLGRIEYLLSDKTGTLTQNDMEMKKLHLGTVLYAGDTMDIVSDYVKGYDVGGSAPAAQQLFPKARRDMGNRVRDLVTTLAICHNVTPTFDEGELTYQAASPDETAIVKYCEVVGLLLFKRDRHLMTLAHTASGKQLVFKILQVFPFNSDTKRMGIVVHDTTKDELWFMEKGADTVMSLIVQQNDWLEEETGNMAREGLRTLVVGRKRLTPNLYREFVEAYEQALLAMTLDRDQQMQRVVERFLELDLELLGLTGVEDKLQRDVKVLIELLRNAGIKIWMLTGDKVETARCVSISAKLISRGQYVHTVTRLSRVEGALQAIEYLRSNTSACLLIDGELLGLYLKHYPREFVEVVVRLPVVVACRCTPQQKADVALLIREHTRKRVCCIGDGGNDVSMIQCADVGVGIVGKEGKQALLAADFSVTQFCHLTNLLLWHGRNLYKRSAKLAQFVIHRGLIILVCQAVFLILSHFEPLALYQGWLMVGYATVYTMAPVFLLVLNTDVDETLARVYPELYKELTAGKLLLYRTFFMWVLVLLYQGCVIQGLLQVFCLVDLEAFTKMVAVLYLALVLNELIMVALEINTWRKIMVLTEVVTFALYFFSVPFLKEYFDLDYVQLVAFVWQLLVILVLLLFPVWAVKAIRRRLNPPTYAKVQQE